MKGIFRSINENNRRRLDKILGRKGALKLEPRDLNDSLFEAIRQGKADCVPSLLQAGADPNAEDEEGRSPMFALMEKNGNPATLRELLKSGASPNKVTWNHQQTALHVAAKKGFQVAVKQLVAEGAKINVSDSHGFTPLMFAAREGHITTVKSLLNEGANPNSLNHHQEAAMHLAARAGHGECILELLEENGSPNLLDYRGQTPLYLASKGGYLDVVELLLEYHCDVNCQDAQSGKSPLHWAIGQGNAKLVYTLLRMGAETNIRDAEWQTPFLLALGMGSKDIVSLLMKAGCDVNVTDRNFNQALHIAAKDGHNELVPLLLDAGLDCNLKGAGGLTPLMLAAHGGHATIVRSLLGFAASVSLVDRNKASALTFAIISDAEDANINAVLKMLIRHNASLDESCNLQNLVDIYNIALSPSLLVEDRLYCPAELAYLRGRVPALMMLMAGGCDLHRFKCNELQPMYDCKNHKSDFKNSLYLLKMVKKERFRLKSLRELCRRPALEACGDKIPGGKIGKMPVSDQVKRYLNYEDLDVIERSYTMTMGGRKSVSETPGLGSIAEGGFSRTDRRRQTIQAGERRQGTGTGSLSRTPGRVSSRTPSKPASATPYLNPDSAFRRSLRGTDSPRSQGQTPGGQTQRIASGLRKTVSTSSSSRSSASSQSATRPSSARTTSSLTRSASAASSPSKPRPRSSLECSMTSTERASSSLARSASAGTHSGTQRQYSSLTRSSSTASDRSGTGQRSQTGQRAAPSPRSQTQRQSPGTASATRYMLPSSRCTSPSPRSNSSSRSASPTPGWMLSHADTRPPTRQGIPGESARQGHPRNEPERPPSRQGKLYRADAEELFRPPSRQGRPSEVDPRPPSRQGNSWAENGEVARPPSRQGHPWSQGHSGRDAEDLTRQPTSHSILRTDTRGHSRPLSAQGQGGTPDRHVSWSPSRHNKQRTQAAAPGGLRNGPSSGSGQEGAPQPLSPLSLNDGNPAVYNPRSDFLCDVTVGDPHPDVTVGDPHADEGYPTSPTDSGIEADPERRDGERPGADPPAPDRRPTSRIPVPTFQRTPSFRSAKSDMVDDQGKSYFVRSRSVRKW